jgi:hypothetical protein
MDDLIQLGAYVVIILIIGGASVIKKIIEARKRRQEIEKIQGKTLRLDVGQPQETEAQTPQASEESEDEIILESEPETQSGQKPRIEDILNEVFNIPTVTHKRTTVIREKPRTQKDMPEPAKNMQMAAAAVDESISEQPETVTQSAEPNWEVFATGLKNRELTEIQRAIVMSELIQKPRARRMGRS